MQNLLIATQIKIYETLILALVNTVFMFFASFKFVQTLQQSGYDGGGYMSWLRRKDNIYLLRLIIVSLLSLLAFLITNISAMIFTDKEFVIYIGLGLYALFFAVYIKKDRSVKTKVPLVKTNRIKRLLASFILLSFLMVLIVMLAVNLIAYLVQANPDNLLYRLRYGLICFSPMLLPITVLLAYFINQPFESYNKKRYVEKCKQTLNERKDLIKIGITGSYGKTSVKEILAKILSEKYSVLATPHSFNTPMGICKTVKLLKEHHEVFIAEMGARRVGEIKELTEIVNPDYAILTGVIAQHVETFGSITNVKKTKYEIIENMNANGYAVFSADNEITAQFKQKCPIKCDLAGLNKAKAPKVYAENIVMGSTGTKFTLVFGENKIECSTLLIGAHNVSNICLAVAIALEIGLSEAEIRAGISRIEPIRHRLEIFPSREGITIIDDSYNSNIKGTVAAMEVLDCFEGRKIVLTPGLVELGSVEEHENYMFGVRLASHADKVVLVGKRRIERIKEGLISADFSQEDIICVKDLDEGKKVVKEMVKTGDVVLFENDLPDRYN